MIYEIHCDGKVIGTTKFERADPPMGFVIGEFAPSTQYDNSNLTASMSLFVQSTKEQIQCESVTIEDLSDEFGEQAIEVTALIASSEAYEKYFAHHSDSYANQFK